MFFIIKTGARAFIACSQRQIISRIKRNTGAVCILTG
nr:MAG TPA_asm: hypothetical protein [Caudoviricetes sp.]